MGAAISDMLRAPHERCPVKLFLLLEDETIAELLSEEPECLFDDFSLRFITQHKHHGLGHPDAVATLRAIAQVHRYDISDIEARHASLRRLLKAAPQAKALGERVLSAIWVGMALAKRQPRAGGRGTKKSQPQAPIKKKPSKARRLRRSVWQAFCHEQASGGIGKADFRRLGRLYNNLPEAELVRLGEKARLASLPEGGDRSTRHGAFKDPMRRALAKAAVRRKELQWHRRRQSLSGSQRLDSLLEEALNEGHRGGAVVQAACRGALFDRQMSARSEATDLSQLAAFRDTQRDRLLEKAWSAILGLEPLLADMAPFPSQMASYELAPNTTEVAYKMVDPLEQHQQEEQLVQCIGVGLGPADGIGVSGGLGANPERPRCCSQEGDVQGGRHLRVSSAWADAEALHKRLSSEGAEATSEAPFAEPTASLGRALGRRVLRPPSTRPRRCPSRGTWSRIRPQ